MAGVLAAEPAGEVDVAAAVDVLDLRAAGARDDEVGRGDAARHEALALGEDPLGLGALCRRHARLANR